MHVTAAAATDSTRGRIGSMPGKLHGRGYALSNYMGRAEDLTLARSTGCDCRSR